MADVAGSQQERFGILTLAEVDLTNSEAMRRALAGERGPLWIVADRQTNGRGRSGRSWQSPSGNLYASLLFEPGCEPSIAQQISLVAGVAVIDALLPVLGSAVRADRRLRLKWPNDILYDNGKLGGILIEATTAGDRRITVVGIGINLCSVPEGVGRAVTSVDAHMSAVPERREVMGALTDSMQHWLETWSDGRGFDSIRSAWLERAGPVGEVMSVKTERSEFAGRFAGLDASGALLMQDAKDQERRFTFGEVSLGVSEGLA